LAQFLLNFDIEMAKNKKKKKENELSEPEVTYGRPELVFFNSFEEMNEYDRVEMAKLSPEETLQQMRRFINIAYGMHGFDPNKLPQNHTIEVVPYNPK
jgi:hypothetical protein